MNGLPTVLSERHTPGHSEFDILVAGDNPWFEGHFPGRPILPGVIQIAWAVHYAAALHADARTPRAVEQVKFRRPIVPGMRLTLQLTHTPDAARLRYAYRDALHSYSSGTLEFGSGA